MADYFGIDEERCQFCGGPSPFPGAAWGCGKPGERPETAQIPHEWFKQLADTVKDMPPVIMCEMGWEHEDKFTT